MSGPISLESWESVCEEPCFMNDSLRERKSLVWNCCGGRQFPELTETPFSSLMAKFTPTGLWERMDKHPAYATGPESKRKRSRTGMPSADTIG